MSSNPFTSESNHTNPIVNSPQLKNKEQTDLNTSSLNVSTMANSAEKNGDNPSPDIIDESTCENSLIMICQVNISTNSELTEDQLAELDKLSLGAAAVDIYTQNLDEEPGYLQHTKKLTLDDLTRLTAYLMKIIVEDFVSDKYQNLPFFVGLLFRRLLFLLKNDKTNFKLSNYTEFMKYFDDLAEKIINLMDEYNPDEKYELTLQEEILELKNLIDK